MENVFGAENVKVLVVDDNLINREIAKEFLSTYHFKVWEAQDGFQAVDLVKDIKFHVIFMDYMMPEMNGAKTVEKIRGECGENGKYPVIIGLTANETEGGADHLLEKGFQAVLSNPLSRERLDQVLSQFVPGESMEVSTDDLRHKGTDPGFCKLDIPGIDKELAEKYHGESLGDYRELLSLYVLDGRRKTVLLTELVEKKEYKKYEVEVHGLKSASANIGALGLSLAFREQELAAERGDGEFIAQNFIKVLALFKEQMESIETYLKAGKEQERQEKPPIADDVLAGELKTALEKILKLRLGESLDKIESLESYSLRKEVRERLTEIKVQLKLYEDSRAEELLQELLDDLAEEEL